MALKFYLNKFLKVDNVEQYTLTQILELKNVYSKFIEDSEGFDPDFPMSTFGEKGKKVAGTNVHTLERNRLQDEVEEENDIPKAPEKKSEDVNERALAFLKNIGM